MDDKVYLVQFEVTVRGTTVVSADNSEKAGELAIKEVTYPATCEMVDWDILNCTEEEEI
jgi:hypothetical protein